MSRWMRFCWMMAGMTGTRFVQGLMRAICRIFVLVICSPDSNVQTHGQTSSPISLDINRFPFTDTYNDISILKYNFKRSPTCYHLHVLRLRPMHATRLMYVCMRERLSAVALPSRLSPTTAKGVAGLRGTDDDGSKTFCVVGVLFVLVRQWVRLFSCWTI